METCFSKSLFVAAIISFCTVNCQAQQQKVDVLITNAYVFNGDGKDSVQLNVGISGNRITYLGKGNINAKEVIDAKGKFVAPGFIDPHTHADRWIIDRKRNQMLAWLYQGVTTVFAGNDGFGEYKIIDRIKEFEDIGMGTNFALYVGFGPVRRAILKNNNITPNIDQLEEMKKLVVEGLKEGAIGFSTGLIYLPQMFSKTSEVAALYKEAAKLGAIYDTHMRNEGNNVVESVKEVLKIGQDSFLPLHISHIKVAGENNWGKSEEVIKVIEKARKRGIDITANQYPFEASMTGLKATLIPAWAQEGGDKATLARFQNPTDLVRIKKNLSNKSNQMYKNIIIMSNSKSIQDINAKSVYDIAKLWNMSNEDAAIEILEKNIGTSCVNFSMGEQDILNFMKQPWVMTGSDGGGLHPRTYSTFTRIIEEYVMKRKVMSLSWAIHRATGLTATTFKLKDRGFIREGYIADLIVFDPKNIKANATYEKPELLSEGMDYVFVNGVKAIDKGRKTSKLAGKIIKKQ